VAVETEEGRLKPAEIEINCNDEKNAKDPFRWRMFVGRCQVTSGTRYK